MQAECPLTQKPLGSPMQELLCAFREQRDTTHLEEMFKAQSHSVIHALSHLTIGFEFFKAGSIAKEAVQTFEKILIIRKRMSSVAYLPSATGVLDTKAR